MAKSFKRILSCDRNDSSYANRFTRNVWARGLDA